MVGGYKAYLAAESGTATRLETHSRAEYPGSKAVLVAIAIPVFTTQLEKSREATDLSNIRNIYAEAALVVLNGDVGSGEKSSVTDDTISVTKDPTKGYVKEVTVAGFKPNQQVEGWIIDVSNVAGQNISAYKPVKGEVR